jgi:hypothetical protein
MIKFVLAALMSAYSAIASADSIRVMNEDNQPVAGATVLLGFEQGNPFPNNVVKTGGDGLTGVPTDWKAALPVTVQAPGYVTTTIPVLLPGEHTITISKADPTGNFEVSGVTQNFGRLVQDGKVDFAMVLPAMRRDGILSFDIGSVMSPENDTINIMGKSIDIPSNITLPNQTETYILPITLDKPAYRSYLREKGSYQLYAMHGQFPLKKVVDDIRAGKSLFEVINHFTFLEAGQKTVNVNGNVGNITMDVNQTPFNGSLAVKAPNFATGKVMIAMAMAEKNGLFVPTDLKRFTAGQSMNLKTNAALGKGGLLSMLVDEPTNIVPDFQDQEDLNKINPLILMVSMAEGTPLQIPLVKDYNFAKLTIASNVATGTVNPTFLPMIDKPTLSGNVMKVKVPALGAGLSPAAMYIVLTEIEKLGTGSIKSERRTRLWEVWSPGWIPQVEMPKISFQKNPNRSYRWEVMFLARPSTFVFDTLPSERVDLKQVTHITRNAMDL